MRIISGKFKNKKLCFPKNLKTRPLKDSVRENIFNILEHSNTAEIKIKNSFIIDLYAGSGSFGLECLSRESSQTFFVENDVDALINLKTNVKILNLENQTTIYSIDVLKFLQNSKLKKKIDLVFLDPPYKNKDFMEVIEVIKKKEIMNKKHIIVLHREKGASNNLKENLNIVENRVYGRSEIFFLKLF